MRNTGRLSRRIGAVVGVTALAAASLAVAAVGGGSSVAARTDTPKPTAEQALRDAQKVVSSDQAAIAAVKVDKHDEVEPTATSVERDGTRHVRFKRQYQGLPVLGGDFVVHSNPDGSFRDATSNLSAPVTVGIKPTLDEKRATAIATKTFTGAREDTTTNLIVDAVQGRPALAWQVVVDGVKPDQSPSHLNVIVDAHSGAIRYAFDQFHTAEGEGHGLQVGDVKVGTTQLANGSYQLIDPDRGNGETRDALNKRDLSFAAFTDADNVWGNGQLTDRVTVGVDAQYGIQATWDYFKNVHGHSGIRGDGKGAVSYVHYGTNYANAGYDEDQNIMIYGDGAPGSKPFTAIDVAGHEMSHGVTAKLAGLIYTGESGGLNEATSDIFGTLVEFSANNPADAPDYLIGEKIDIFGNGNGKPLRYMDDPKKDAEYNPNNPARTSASCWTSSVGGLDVHYSSGVGNHFFYLLAVGSGKSQWGDSPTCNNAPAVTGIGNDKAGKIWFTALDRYMLPNTTYAGAYEATLNAAKDLYGATSTEYKAVKAAWRAVNVTGTDPFPDPAQLPVVTNPGDQASEVRVPVSLQIVARDPQNDAVTFSATGLPVGLKIAPATGLITGTPTMTGTATVVVSATDASGNVGTASFKWTINPAGPPCEAGQLLTNPGFEDGVAPWTEDPAGIVRDGTTERPAHRGTKLASFGGTGAAGTHTLARKVTIPASCSHAKLSFQLRIDTAETANFAKDRFTLSVDDKRIGFWSNKDENGAYTRAGSFDLKAYAGKTVTLTFSSIENAGLPTSFLLDDLVLDVAGTDGARTPIKPDYTVNLTADATGATWTGTQKVAFTNDSATPLTEVYVRLWDNAHGTCPSDQPIKISNLTGGTAGELEVDCTAVKVTLPKALKKDQRATIGFDLSITVPDGVDRFGRSGAYSYLGNALPVLAIRDAAGWHLDPYTNNGESFYQVASDFTVVLDHPSTLKVPATGTSTVEQKPNGRTVTTAKATQVRDFAWVSGPFKSSTTTSAGGVTVNMYWTEKVPDTSAANLQRISADAMDKHGARFGAYPYGDQDVVIDSGFWFGGMEYPGIVLDTVSTTAAVHELAHQWFYGIVGNDEYADPWLDESFADYATDLYLGRTGAGCRITWAGPDEKLTNSMAYWDLHDTRYGSVVYTYGKCALHDLRRVLGDDAMAKLLKDYTQEKWYGISTTAEFKAAAQKAASALPTPVDLTSFWASHRIEG